MTPLYIPQKWAEKSEELFRKIGKNREIYCWKKVLIFTISGYLLSNEFGFQTLRNEHNVCQTSTVVKFPTTIHSEIVLKSPITFFEILILIFQFLKHDSAFFITSFQG